MQPWQPKKAKLDAAIPPIKRSLNFVGSLATIDDGVSNVDRDHGSPWILYHVVAFFSILLDVLSVLV